MKEQFVSVTQAAKILGVSRQLIYRLARQGVLDILPAHPAYEKHGKVKILRAQVEAYAKSKNIPLAE